MAKKKRKEKRKGKKWEGINLQSNVEEHKKGSVLEEE